MRFEDNIDEDCKEITVVQHFEHGIRSKRLKFIDNNQGTVPHWIVVNRSVILKEPDDKALVLTVARVKDSKSHIFLSEEDLGV